MSTKKKESAVSPVIAIMLMLVVTIVIAAVVSAFAGGTLGSQKKIPQASIAATYGISEGLQIRHAGGDPIPMHDVVFTIWDGPTFGTNVDKRTKQVLDLTRMLDESGNQVKRSDGTYNSTALKPGDIFSITADNCDCDLLQPNISPTDYVTGSGASYSGTQTARWGLCIKNPQSIGKRFMVSLSTKSGDSIAQTEVPIKG